MKFAIALSLLFSAAAAIAQTPTDVSRGPNYASTRLDDGTEIASGEIFVKPHAPRMMHNLSATSNLLAKGQCTIGLQIAACGVTENLNVGSSVWMWTDYRMGNASMRYKWSEDSEGRKWVTQLSYFKTMHRPSKENFGYRWYEMEAIWLQTIRSYKLAPHYSLHLNLATNYYINDKMPFSLRRPIPGRNDMQINFSSLHEVDLINGWFIQGEIGLIDIVQPQFYIHSGASIGRATKNWTWHTGVSVTGTPRALYSPTRRLDYQQLLRSTPEGFDGPLSKEAAKYDYAMHPEMSLQYFF